MEGLNFSVSGESAGPSGLKHFVSPPPVRKYDESYEIRRKGLLRVICELIVMGQCSYYFLVTVLIDAELPHTNKTRSPLLTETVTPVGQNLFSPLLNHATEKSGLLCDLACNFF